MTSFHCLPVWIGELTAAVCQIFLHRQLVCLLCVWSYRKLLSKCLKTSAMYSSSYYYYVSGYTAVVFLQVDHRRIQIQTQAKTTQNTKRRNNCCLWSVWEICWRYCGLLQGSVFCVPVETESGSWWSVWIHSSGWKRVTRSDSIFTVVWKIVFF